MPINHLKKYPLNNHTIPLEEAKKLGDEYGDLMVLPFLSDEQETRMDEILSLATRDSNVDFWVARAACDRGADIGLLSPEMLEHYENQRAALRERMELDIPPEPVAETILWQQVRAACNAYNNGLDRIADEVNLTDIDSNDQNKAGAQAGASNSPKK
jgi:hypothetical protein